MDFFIVVDVQNDFVTGSLGTEQAKSVPARISARLKQHTGPVLYTLDTHGEDYLSTREGRALPVEHCIRGTWGWQLAPELGNPPEEERVEKKTFAAETLPDKIRCRAGEEPIERIVLAGLCTDICVLSNAVLLRMAFPETEIVVAADCCAGVTEQSHYTALEALRACQITIEAPERKGEISI